MGIFGEKPGGVCERILTGIPEEIPKGISLLVCSGIAVRIPGGTNDNIQAKFSEHSVKKLLETFLPNYAEGISAVYFVYDFPKEFLKAYLKTPVNSLKRSLERFQRKDTLGTINRWKTSLNDSMDKFMKEFLQQLI